MKKPLLELNNVYHIYNHGNGNDNLFIEEKNYYYFLKLFKKHIGPIVDVYSYCLLPNHFHVMLKIKDFDTLQNLAMSDELFVKRLEVSLIKNGSEHQGFLNLDVLELKTETLEMYVIQKFSNFFNSYAKAFNKVYKRRGSLFLKNFKRKKIESEHQFMTTFFYIHLNPVKHGFVKNLFNWPYSSYMDYRDQQDNELLDKTEILARFASVEELKKAHELRREIILNQNELE